MKKLVLLAAMAIASMSMFAGGYRLMYYYNSDPYIFPYLEKIYKLGQVSGYVKMFASVKAHGPSTRTLVEVYTSSETLLYCLTESDRENLNTSETTHLASYISKPRETYVRLNINMIIGYFAEGEAYVLIDY